MKMNRIQPLFMLLFALTVFTSCSKEKDETAATENRLALITQSSWKVASISIDLMSDGSIDTIIDQDACEKDNIYSFNTNGSGLVDESTLKCDELDPQSATFQWSLKDNGNIINANIPILGFAGDATIKTITLTTFEFYTDITSNGVSIRTLIKLKH
jgi:PBP1b-binding outer membrane lipoprotein LpoB